MSIETMKQALEALEENHHLIEEHERPDYLALYDRRIHALRQAIAKAKKQEQEVPEGYKLVMVPNESPTDEPDWDECIRQAEVSTGLKVERNTLSIVIREVRRWLIAKQEQGEPLCTAAMFDDVFLAKSGLDPKTPLYTHPQPAQPKREWVGLTDEQESILNFLLGANDFDGVWYGERHPQKKGAFWWRDELRKAFQEAAHGIGEKK